MRTLAAVTAALILSISSVAFGEEQIQFNVINLSAEQSRQVGNDVMAVIMQAAAQKNSSLEAGRKVNELMSWADQIISEEERVKHQTMNYQTRPVYQERNIVGWNASQQLLLQSSDFDVLTTMLGTLQQQLQIVSMRFEVSSEKRQEELDTLIVEALEAFRKKAELIALTMKAQDYRLVSLSVDENGSRPIAYRGLAQAEAMAVQAPAPSVEAGDSKIEVRVSGSIQLIF